VARDSRGRIKRSAEARYEFKREHPCPSTGRSSGACPGYIIDHVTALSAAERCTIEHAMADDRGVEGEG